MPEVKRTDRPTVVRLADDTPDPSRPWLIQTFTGDVPDPPTRYAETRAAARRIARQLGAQRGPGQPRRAGAQPIVRVELKFGASEVAEVDRARGRASRGVWIRDAALARARKDKP